MSGWNILMKLEKAKSPTPESALAKRALKMGPFEQDVYDQESGFWLQFRSEIKARGVVSEKQGSPARKVNGDRNIISEQDDDDDFGARFGRGVESRASPAAIAARLALARAFDGKPGLLAKQPPPVIILDVPQPDMMAPVAHSWRKVLFKDEVRVKSAKALRSAHESCDVAYMVATERPAASEIPSLQETALAALQLAVPVIAISPLGTTHLPSALTAAVTDRLKLPPLDELTILRTIAIVTGEECQQPLDPTAVQVTGLTELSIAIRFDRTAEQCVAELDRLAALKAAKRRPRDLTLKELHGMPEAVAWAKSMITDIEDWRKGKIGWDQLDKGLVLNGPSGTGKTTFARVAATAFGLNLVTASLGSWQSSGDGHLGHLLRAMRQDFEKARTQAPCVFLFDEVDSIADRSTLRHSHRDYSIQVTNTLLEHIDSLADREVIFIACSNDVTRCDPALLRAGRFNRIIQVGLPDAVELEAMLRVRLGSDLQSEQLKEISELAVGFTGADIERLVKDARRLARHGGRPLSMRDLHHALVGEDRRSEAERRRICVHEAGHLVMEVIYGGPDHVFATAVQVGNAGGQTVRTSNQTAGGTYVEYFRQLQICLAGRVAEEILLGAPSDGAGGSRTSDLAAATSMAAAMVGSMGLAGPAPLLYLGEARDTRPLMVFPQVREAVQAELKKAAAACRIVLEKCRPGLRGVADLLFEHGRVDGAQAMRALRLVDTSADLDPELSSMKAHNDVDG
jgi:cell division protease FtsH